MINIPVKSLDGVEVDPQTVHMDLSLSFVWDGLPDGDDSGEEIDNGSEYLDGFNIVITKIGLNPLTDVLHSAYKSVRNENYDVVIDESPNKFLYTFKNIALPISKVTAYENDTFIDSDNNGQIDVWVRAKYINGNVSKWVNTQNIEIGGLNDWQGDWDNLANKPERPASVFNVTHDFIDEDKIKINFSFNIDIPIDKITIYRQDPNTNAILLIKEINALYYSYTKDENNNCRVSVVDESFKYNDENALNKIVYLIVCHNSLTISQGYSYSLDKPNGSEIDNLVVKENINGFTLNWDITGKRLLDYLTIKMDVKENENDLLEADAIEVFKGSDNSFTYVIEDPLKKDYAHKFWLEVFQKELAYIIN